MYKKNLTNTKSDVILFEKKNDKEELIMRMFILLFVVFSGEQKIMYATEEWLLVMNKNKL